MVSYARLGWAALQTEQSLRKALSSPTPHSNTKTLPVPAIVEYTVLNRTGTGTNFPLWLLLPSATSEALGQGKEETAGSLLLFNSPQTLMATQETAWHVFNTRSMGIHRCSCPCQAFKNQTVWLHNTPVPWMVVQSSTSAFHVQCSLLGLRGHIADGQVHTRGLNKTTAVLTAWSAAAASLAALNV